ncbi:hypothetical protein NQ317_004824 [Molorchus minor]|uniref:Uncharacterized protein n=1 Tax=Molorchus minor TaxID=1323400 RepID=A0ABQ9IV39_9CUCU|nr:hypothetical protein NQ317_004824 [Molorchus minor]
MVIAFGRVRSRSGVLGSL